MKNPFQSLLAAPGAPSISTIRGGHLLAVPGAPSISTIRGGFRLTWFWVLSIVGLAAPWIVSAFRHYESESFQCRVANVSDGDTLFRQWAAPRRLPPKGSH